MVNFHVHKKRKELKENQSVVLYYFPGGANNYE